MKSVEVVGQEIVVLMSIERLKFRQIVFSVSLSYLTLYHNRIGLSKSLKLMNGLLL